MKMTFGKYKGMELSQVPVAYLRWVLDDASEQAKTPDLIRAIREQLEAVRPQPIDMPIADEEPLEDEEPVLEDVPPEEASKDTSYLLAELYKARAELKQSESERAALQDRLDKFAEYFEKWHRIVIPLLQLERNHAAEVYFNALKKEIDKWHEG